MNISFFRRFSAQLLALTLLSIGLFAQAPSGYYDNAEGKTGAQLKTALYNIIKGHTDLGYGGLYSTYQSSDNILINGQNRVYDMYSIRADGTANYYYSHTSSDQCGNYNSEGDCYNREHTVPQSWFNESTPMKSDAHHVVPTDGKVNGIRNNFPHAEVGSASTTTTNGSKLGSCSTSGYSGTVFEPIDEYKGDFARIYMYMATRYENVIANWSDNSNANTVLAGNSFPAYKEWYVALLLKWHEQDPVSDKELERNEAIYDRQHNRNPFIDNPDYAEMIWGDGSAIESNMLSQVNIYPNPTSGMLTIECAEFEVTKVELYNMLGACIYEEVCQGSDMKIDMSNYLKGVYIIKIWSDSKVYIFKVVKK